MLKLVASVFVTLVAVVALTACTDSNQNPKAAPTPAATGDATPKATPASTASPTPMGTNPSGGGPTDPAGTMPAGPATTAPPATGAGAGDAVAQADTIFSQRCSVCHGMSGKGDGVGAAALNPKPRNYTDAAWQASVTDEQIGKTIVEGGAAMGKSPLMAPNADLKDKPDVVKALVAKVRSFKGK